MTLLLPRNLNASSNPISLDRPLRAYSCCQPLSHANSGPVLTQQLPTTKPTLSNSWPDLEQRLVLMIRKITLGCILFLLSMLYSFSDQFHIVAHVFQLPTSRDDSSTIIYSSDLSPELQPAHLNFTLYSSNLAGPSVPETHCYGVPPKDVQVLTP